MGRERAIASCKWIEAVIGAKRSGYCEGEIEINGKGMKIKRGERKDDSGFEQRETRGENKTSAIGEVRKGRVKK